MANARVARILILTSDTGGGHRSVANAIRAALNYIVPEQSLNDVERQQLSDEKAQFAFSMAEYTPPAWGQTLRPWQGSIVDIFQQCAPAAIRRTSNLYAPTVGKRPYIWNSFYNLTNSRTTYASLTTLTSSLMRRGLTELLLSSRPDVIVSTHPLLIDPVLNIVQKLRVRVPFITVVTDLVKFHRAWANADVDECTVPTQAAYDLLVQMGMPPQKLRLVGIPIHPRFSLPAPDRTKVLSALGLAAERFTVLLIGGGDGVGSIGATARALGASQLPIQQIVVTGRNKNLRAELDAERESLGVPTAVLGFTSDMPNLMRAVDIIITKAGSLTLSESLACGLPIILSSVIPGQEVGNVDYLEAEGVGQLAPTAEDIVTTLSDYLALSPEEYAEIRAHARAISKPLAAFDTARLVMNYLPGPRAISAWDRVAARPRRRRTGHRRRPRVNLPVSVLPAPTLERLRKLPALMRRRRRSALHRYQ